MANKITAWDRVTMARDLNRPTALDYIENIFDDFIELHGDRLSKDDKSIVCGLATLNNQTYTIIAEQKGRNTKENIERNFGMPNPESYRKALRFMKQAEKICNKVCSRRKRPRRSYCKKLNGNVTTKSSNNSICNWRRL